MATANDIGQNGRSLPDGWEWSTVGKVVSFEYGKGLTEKKRDQTGKVPVYGSNGIVGYHSSALVQKPCLIIGRKGAAGAVHKSDVPCWPIDTTYYAIPPEGVNLSFLYYLFCSLDFSSLDRSTAIPGLNRNDAYAVDIPLPPLPEQERIVSRIEELFSDLDAGVAALERVRVGLKRHKAAVLKAAVTGQLVNATHENWKRELPDGWQRVPVGEVATRVTDGTHKTPKYVEDGIPFISVNNISADGLINFLDTKHITAEEHEELYSRCNPERGDVLLTKVGTVGLTAVVTTDSEFSLFVNTALIKPVHERVSPEFLAYALRFGFISKLYESSISGSTQKFIGTGKIAELRIPLPPLPSSAKSLPKSSGGSRWCGKSSRQWRQG